MKTLTRTLIVAVGLGVQALVISSTWAQGTMQTTTTTTTRGTVSELTPNTIVLKTDAAALPVRYTFTRTTTYVDENGNPVSVETVKSGLPVTVYYDQNGSTLTATKVVVQRNVSTVDTAAPVTIASAPAQDPGPPSANGIVRDSDSDSLSIRSDVTAAASHYKARESTAYVDEGGNPVARSSVRPGTPVTVFFERDGDSLVATRVIVRNSPPTTQVIEEKRTTTTTQQP